MSCTTVTRALRDDLLRVALRDGWDRALMAIGWLHLGFFAVNQWAAMALNRNWPHLVLWPMEVLAVAATLRLMLGAGWSRSTPLAGVLVRVWITFLIIAFNAATLNGLTGLELKWYFLVWAGLSTFGFATTAWLCNTRFLIPAVFMYFVGLAMAHWIAWSFLIHAFALVGRPPGHRPGTPTRATPVRNPRCLIDPKVNPGRNYGGPSRWFGMIAALGWFWAGNGANHGKGTRLGEFL